MRTKAIRILEKELYRWPDVKRKVEYGAHNYYVGNKHFASVDADALWLMRVTPEDRVILRDLWGVAEGDVHQYGFQTRVPLDENNALKLLPFIKRSYDHTLTWKGV
jgi:hypothetical protein